MFEKDNLFDHIHEVVDFSFDEKTTAVFPDMIHRSIPGYATLLSLIAVIGSDFVDDNALIYDLGCSLGGASLALQGQISASNKIIAIDSSAAMVERFREFISGSGIKNIKVLESDVLSVDFKPCQLVIMNFLLQFIPAGQRKMLLQKIYDALDEKGALLLSEKTQHTDSRMQHWYERFKEYRGYSQMAIARKRESLENVMITDTAAQEVQRLHEVGFKTVTPYYQGLLFCGWIAEK